MFSAEFCKYRKYDLRYERKMKFCFEKSRRVFIRVSKPDKGLLEFSFFLSFLFSFPFSLSSPFSLPDPTLSPWSLMPFRPGPVTVQVDVDTLTRPHRLQLRFTWKSRRKKLPSSRARCVGHATTPRRSAPPPGRLLMHESHLPCSSHAQIGVKQQ